METLNYQIILASFVAPLFLSGLMLWFFIRYQGKKHQYELEKKDALLRHQALLLEKQQAVEHERARIASEMHDDLGSGLTTIRYLSERALRMASDAQEAQQIERIAQQSNILVTNMSEIIWAMNSRFDTVENLAGYIRRYASEFLEEHEMPLKYSMALQNGDRILTGERRRNVFLVIKEALHNTVKYSGASEVVLEIEANAAFHVRLTESNARGFDHETAVDSGNGLYNMQRRMDEIGGSIVFRKNADAMEIELTLPLENGTS